MEYVFSSEEGKVINAIQYSKTKNRKLGFNENIIGTYHFGEEQVRHINLKLDSKSCLDCPLSHTNKSPACYTHKGYQMLGLYSKLNKLNKYIDDIKPFNEEIFNSFIKNLSYKSIHLVRFGVYGEPIHLSIPQILKLISVSKSFTGYTHQWTKYKYQAYSNFFMASTHSKIEADIASDSGWRVFNVGLIGGAINCPASKESGNKSTCVKCKLCSGRTGSGNKNIYIEKH